MRTLVVSTLLISLSACTNVKISADNPSNVTQAITVEDLESSGNTSASYDLGDVPAHSTTIELGTIQVWNGHKVEVRSTGGLDTKKSVLGDVDPLSVTVSLPQPSGTSVDDETGISELSKAFENTGKPSGFPPTDATQIVRVIGSFICYDPGATSADPAVIRYPVPPGRLSPLLTLDQITYSNFSYSKNVDVTSSASAKASVSVPVYGSATTSFTSDSVRKYVISVKGNLANFKPESARFSLIDSLNNNLTNQEKKTIINEMSNPTTVCTYINRFWVVQALNLSHIDGKKVTNAANIQAGSVFTAEGAYNYGNTVTQDTTIGNAVVNYDGPVLRFRYAANSTPQKLLIEIVPPGAPQSAASSSLSQSQHDIGAIAKAIAKL